MNLAELFDTVELIVDLPEYDLRAGSRGAVVDKYDGSTVEVEFADANGETRYLLPLQVHQFIVVWQHATHSQKHIEPQPQMRRLYVNGN